MEKLLYNLSNYYKKLAKSKSKSKIQYWYSELILFFTLKLAEYLRSKKINEVDKVAVKKYFNLYGTEATLSNYNFTIETLIEILGFNIKEIDLDKFKEFKGI